MGDFLNLGLTLGAVSPREGVAFSPHQLFTSGEAGVWYDPSDLTTMFTTNNVLTQVAVDSDPVGCVLDKRLWGGQSLSAVIAGQSDKVTNGDNVAALMSTSYIGGAVGATNGTVAQSSDLGTAAAKYLCNTATLTSHYITLGTVPAGRAFRITGRVHLSSGGMARVAVVDTSDGSINQTIASSVKDAWLDFTVMCGPKATARVLALGNNNSESVNGATFSITDLSIKEIPGNHALQATAGARPLYKTSGGHHWIEGDGVDDLLRSAFTMSQPYEHIVAARPLRWTLNDILVGGAATVTGILYQSPASPSIRLFNGGQGPAVDAPVDEDVVLSAHFEGASSWIARNDEAKVTGNPSTGTAGGVTLFATSAGAQFGKFRCYGLIVRVGTLTDAQMARARSYMSNLFF